MSRSPRTNRRHGRSVGWVAIPETRGDEIIAPGRAARSICPGDGGNASYGLSAGAPDGGADQELADAVFTRISRSRETPAPLEKRSPRTNPLPG